MAATILLVEDDRAIRYLFTHVLERSGYVVIACEDGMRGVEEACARIDGVDAVVTDAHMPGMNGSELIFRIRALRPEIPVIMVSGSVEAEMDPLPDDAATVRLSKPVSPDRLRRELRRLLSRHVTAGISRASMR